jgi:hypothetical protein
MALSDNDKLVLEAIANMLHDEGSIGLPLNDVDDLNADERGSQYLHSSIDDLFTLKANRLMHAESVISAFHKVHSHKYVTDFSFVTAMDKEMRARGVPTEERTQAMLFIPDIMEQLNREQKEWCEQDAGFNPRLSEVRQVSKPEQPLNYKKIDSPLNNRNMDRHERGDASMPRMGES